MLLDKIRIQATLCAASAKTVLISWPILPDKSISSRCYYQATWRDIGGGSQQTSSAHLGDSEISFPDGNTRLKSSLNWEESVNASWKNVVQFICKVQKCYGRPTQNSWKRRFFGWHTDFESLKQWRALGDGGGPTQRGGAQEGRRHFLCCLGFINY